MPADGDPGASWAQQVRRAHEQARRDFLVRLRAEQAKIAAIAKRARDEAVAALGEDASSDSIARSVAQRIGRAQRDLGRQIEETITQAPAATRRRLAGVNVTLGPRTLENNQLPQRLVVAGQRQRERSAAALPITGEQRFRARTQAETTAVLQHVREGLRRGESIRAVTKQIETANPHGPQIPAYVNRVIEALRGGVSDAQLARLSADVRHAASRLGSATDNFRTIQPAVVRLARAVESGNREAIQQRVDQFIARKMQYEASRIARTEAARASSRAQVESARSTIGVTALEWRRSSSHPVEDICDVYAEADLYGLGPGRYPVDDAPELPAHPQCLCTLVPVITHDSIVRALRREPEPPRGEPTHASPEAWLRDQPRDVQARILGRGNAELLRGGQRVISATGQVMPLGARTPR